MIYVIYLIAMIYLTAIYLTAKDAKILRKERKDLLKYRASISLRPLRKTFANFAVNNNHSNQINHSSDKSFK